EIWQRLPLARTVDSIIIAPFPKEDARLSDPSAEAEMAPLIESIEGIRIVRGGNNISPAAKLPAIIHSASDADRAVLQKWSHYLKPLAGLPSLEVSSAGIQPKGSATFVGTRLQIYVPLAGLIDFSEERSRLAKEIARVEADLESLNKKLNNPNFAAKAPR